MSVFPAQDNFTRGEISPRLHAQASLELYRAGLSRCENFLTLPHGGIRKRGGTYFVSGSIDSSKAHRLIPFIFSDDQAYCLLIGHLKMWVFAYGARVGTVEVTTPWASTELAELSFVGSKDQMWITHPSYDVRLLTRTAHTTWALTTFRPNDGPFDAVNADESKQMYVSAATGSVTITSDFAGAFAAADIGRLVRIDMESFRTIKPWEPGILAYEDSGPAEKLPICRYNGNVYDLDFTPTPGADYRTGATPPTHTKGTEWDGTNTNTGSGTVSGVAWTCLHSGFGVARITAYTDSQHVTATVLSTFPAELVGSGNKSFVWRLGALHSGDYANGVAIFEERLALGVGNSVYASGSFKLDSFKPGPEKNDALQFLLVGDDIAWLADADGTLAVGTIGGVKALSGSGLDEALTPDSFKLRKTRTATCAPIQPVDVGSGFIYVAKNRQVLVEMALTNIGRFETKDMGQISEHIPKRGVVEIAFQNYPDPYLWFPLLTGEIGGYTYQPAEEVRGMHRHRIGGAFGATAYGVVESVCVTPGQTGADDVWLLVKRTIGGATKRYLEIMTTAFEYGDIQESIQLDCSLTYDDVPVSSVTGMDHLAGETVDVLAGGFVYKGLVVGSTGPNIGKVTLPGSPPPTAAKWCVGYRMPGYADTLALDIGAQDGSLLGRPKRVSHVTLSLLETDRTGLEISSLIKGRWEPVTIPTNLSSDNTVPSLWTGDVKVKIDDSWSGQGRISVRHTNPTPCTIRAMVPVYDFESADPQPRRQSDG